LNFASSDDVEAAKTFGDLVEIEENFDMELGRNVRRTSTEAVKAVSGLGES
jgi:hypothetical protein